MTKGTKFVGMIVPTVDNSFFSGLAANVEREMAKADYRTLIISCSNDADKERACLRELSAMGTVNGMICVSGLSELQDGVIPDTMPLVWVDRVPRSARKIPWVANDDAAATEKATDFLIEKGCSNILLLPGFLAEHQESPRVAGYRRALAKHDIAFSPTMVLNREGIKSSEEETGDLVRATLAADISVDGIITSSDRAAFGAITALRSVGYFVPEDVRLISFDNSSYSAMASPPITALDRKTDILAAKACEIMLRMIAHEDDIPMENIVDVYLEKRDSTR